MNEKKILIVNEEQNIFLEGDLINMLVNMGFGVDLFSPTTSDTNLAATYAFAIVLYTHAAKDIEQCAECRGSHLNTTFRHGVLLGALGTRNVGVLYTPGSDPYIKNKYLSIEARTDSDWVWKIKLLNRLRDSGFQINEAKFIELAKSV